MNKEVVQRYAAELQELGLAPLTFNQKLSAIRKKRSALFWMTTGLILVYGIGAADLWTGSEVAFSLFYLIPIMLVTWFAGRAFGIVIDIASAITWLAADVLAGQAYSQPMIRYWNAAIRLGFFVVVTILLAALKELVREKEIARTDYLTGVANRRFFFEVAQREIDRSQRYQHPFAIAYIDLDGLKAVNDQWGHQVGDRLLCAVVNRAKTYLRKTDTLARVGGDEFILLLPETDQNASQAIVTRIQAALLGEMQRNDWPVTFSVGVLTCQSAEVTTDELVTKADELMYSVKRNGKNAVAYAVYAG